MNGKTDLRYVKSAAKMIGEHLNSYSVVCTKSTSQLVQAKKLLKLLIIKKTNISFDYISNPEF